MAASFTAFAKFRAHDGLSRKYKAMSGAAGRFANKTQVAMARVERSVRKLTRRFGSLGAVIGTGLIIGAVSNIVGTFANFEQANASLASVMANATRPELDALEKDAKRLGATTAKSATEVVGLQEAFSRLGFGAKDILNMTESTISGSVAMQGELADTAELVGAMVKSFDAFGSVNAPTIIDQMTAATQQSALNFEKLQTGLPIVAGAANAAEVPFTRLLASMGKLSDAGIDASSSTTALRNIFLEAAKRGVPYQTLLDKVKNSTDQLKVANELFGKRGAVAAVILAKNTEGVNELDKALQGAAGTAGISAAKQLDTLKGSVTILKSAWEGFILSVEDGNGKIGNALKTIVRTATEVLSLATGTEKAKDQLSETELRIRQLSERAMVFLRVLKYLAIAYASLKAVIFLNNAVMATKAMVMDIYLGVLKIATAAQWLFAAAVNVGLWPVLAIMAAIGLLIMIVRSLIKNWELVKAAFSEGGILKGLITIGKVILDAILLPVQKLLELIGKIPGLKIATEGAEGIENFRNKLFDYERSLLPQNELTTTNTAAAQESMSREERITKQQATLNINDNTGKDISVDSPLAFPIKLNKTNGQ